MFVNRISDWLFIIGILSLYLNLQTLDFDVLTPLFHLLATTPTAYPNLATIGLLLFLGAMGKSAQIGFHV